jgi:hypothetical protein
MSIMRCEVGDHNVDSDYKEFYKMDDLDACEDCYDKAKEKDDD